jgi:hypothetical protein
MRLAWELLPLGNPMGLVYVTSHYPSLDLSVLVVTIIVYQTLNSEFN